jgi:hypothetical protein
MKRLGNTEEKTLFFVRCAKTDPITAPTLIYASSVATARGKKIRPLFLRFFLAIQQKIRPWIYSAADIFLGPLLRFAAEILAGCQYCIRKINLVLICLWLRLNDVSACGSGYATLLVIIAAIFSTFYLL